MNPPLLNHPQSNWVCPNCDFTDVTYEVGPHSRFHNCRGLKGLSAPMVPEGTRCEIKANEREDYVNGEIVQRDGDGRPIMNVITTRDGGQDCAVYAPTAQLFSIAHPPGNSKSGRNVSVGAQTASVSEASGLV